MPPQVTTTSRSGSYARPVRSATNAEIAARRSWSPVNGSHELAARVSSEARVISIASGGKGRSVSRFSILSTGHAGRRAAPSAAAATRSMPKPRTAASR